MFECILYCDFSGGYVQQLTVFFCQLNAYALISISLWMCSIVHVNVPYVCLYRYVWAFF